MPEMVASLVVPGASEWLALSDDLLAGLVHALNNRITALSVCAELAGMGDEEMLKEGLLLAEVVRLQRVAAQFGMMSARGQPEALEVAPVMDDALAIHALHPRMRAVECELAREGEAQPVRTPRWALLRALLVLVDGAKSGAQHAGRSEARIRLVYDEASVRVVAPSSGGDGAYAREMATLCGGTLGRQGDQLVLTLPSLRELRTREQPGAAR